MHDAIALERQGLPVAVVVTEAFVREAELTRRALGMPALSPVIVPHPLSTLSDAEIAGRARAACLDVIAVLTTTPT